MKHASHTEDENETICEDAMETIEDVKAKMCDIQENIANYVKEHPLKSVGFSIIAGIVAAQILKRRK